jgi:predicted nuclease of predicted toxin-antitoxin system
VPLRVLLDEHISPDVAHRLAALGFDVVCARDRGLANKRIKDWELMAWCVEHQRAVCTQNGPDFEREHRRCLARGEHHYGVLIVGQWTPQQTYETLRQYLESNPDRDRLMDHVLILPMASPDTERDPSAR